MLLLPLFLVGVLDDCLFMTIRGVPVVVICLAFFTSKPVCLFVYLDPAVCWNPLLGQVCLCSEVDQGSFHVVEILAGILLQFADDRECILYICEDDHIGLGLG